MIPINCTFRPIDGGENTVLRIRILNPNPDPERSIESGFCRIQIRHIAILILFKKKELSIKSSLRTQFEFILLKFETSPAPVAMYVFDTILDLGSNLSFWTQILVRNCCEFNEKTR